MKSEYAAAFERQLDWLRWDSGEEADQMWRKAPSFGIKSVTRDGVDTHSLDRSRRYYREPLLYGDVYYVSPKIQEWLVKAKEIDRLPEIPLDVNWCPSEFGFVVLSKQLDLSAGVASMKPLRTTVVSGPGLPKFDMEIQAKPDEKTVHAVAFGWSPSQYGLEVVFYSDRLAVEIRQEVMDAKVNEMLRARPEILTMKSDEHVPVIFDQDEVSKVTVQRGYYPVAWFEVVAGTTWRASAKDYRDIANASLAQGGTFEHADVEIAFVYAFLMFVNDRRVVARKHRAERHARKREQAAKPKPTEHVTVVLLRAEEEAEFDGRDPDGVPIPRNYTVRWNVREHMRRHPRTGVKSIRVKAYVKGPPEAPFKDDQRRIFSVSR